jgi:hypothetical protein
MSDSRPDDPLLGARMRDGVSPAATLLRHAAQRTTGTPSPQTVARIAAGLEHRTHRTESRKPFILWWAFASIGCVSVAIAGTSIYRSVRTSNEIVTKPPIQRSAPAKRNTVPDPAPVEAPSQELDPPSIAEPAPAAAVPPRVTRPRIAARAPSPNDDTTASSLAEESRLLADALTSLRKNRDGRGALTTLDRYAQRFPDGELAHEAERTRVEALLSLGRTGETLQRLDEMTFAPLARDTEILLVRAELRAGRNRCVEAESDFSAVLQRASSTQADRALFGRAACRSRRGDVNASRADLQEYGRRFPDGIHIREVKEALSRSP